MKNTLVLIAFLTVAPACAYTDAVRDGLDASQQAIANARVAASAAKVLLTNASNQCDVTPLPICSQIPEALRLLAKLQQFLRTAEANRQTLAGVWQELGPLLDALAHAYVEVEE